jgi:hypothetical protein
MKAGMTNTGLLMYPFEVSRTTNPNMKPVYLSGVRTNSITGKTGITYITGIGKNAEESRKNWIERITLWMECNPTFKEWPSAASVPNCTTYWSPVENLLVPSREN